MSGRAQRWARHLRTARRLDWRSRLLVGEAAAALAAARVLVLAMPIHAVARRLALAPGTASRADDAGVARIARTLRAAARAVPFRALCLEQAIAMAMMLRRRGIAATIHLGTARGADARFEAHAWLSVAGVVVLGGPVDRYVERARL